MNELGVLLQAPPVGIQIQRDNIGRGTVVVRGQFSDSNATIYTAPTGGTLAQGARLKCLVLCNTDSGAHTVTVYGVEDGGTADTTRVILAAQPLAAGGSDGCNARITFGSEGLWLEAGETLQGFASADAKVTYRLEIMAQG